MKSTLTLAIALIAISGASFAGTAADLCATPKSPIFTDGETDTRSDYRYLNGGYVFCPVNAAAQLCDTVVDDKGVSQPANCGATS